jgi:hypothetical protein
VSEVLGHKEVAITLDRYSHALPTMQVEAMALLDAMLGRSPLDVPDKGPADPSQTELWVDQAPASWSAPDGGSDKGPVGSRRTTRRPDPSVNRADEGEVGTAYRIPSETSDASQPRSPSRSKRRMRRMRQDS